MRACVLNFWVHERWLLRDKFSFETTMNTIMYNCIAVFLRYQDGTNSLVVYVIIHIFYSSRLWATKLHARPAKGVACSLFKIYYLSLLHHTSLILFASKKLGSQDTHNLNNFSYQTTWISYTWQANAKYQKCFAFQNTLLAYSWISN